MKHESVMLKMPCEIIEVKPMNPLISKCQIKVCYVSDKPNRNRSIITKDVARDMANSLPGSPIVGYYNEATGDFEEHNRIIDISNGEFKIKDNTRPYGFVDLNAKVWFQKFLDDGVNEREYLMTEGYIWTGQYPESQRILDKGNNQSMELDEKYLDATWTKDNKGKPQFFIINEAIVSKLCILGENYEPCFEGSQITNFKLSFEEGFKESLFSMMNELTEYLKGGVDKVFTRYAVEIGDALWSALYSHIETTYPDLQNEYCSVYKVEGIFEDGEQKFAVLQNNADKKYYRLNFAFGDDGFSPSDTLVEITSSYTPEEEPQFAPDSVAVFETEYAKKKKEEDEKDKDDKKEPEEKEKKCSKCGKPLDECECEDDDEDEKKKAKKKYSLDEVVEYTELKAEYEELQTKYAALESENTGLKAEIEPLRTFKLEVDKKEKQAMIDQFYMLSDEDKADVIENIDTYSVDDIEAKLSIICVRNKVSFDLDDDKKDIKTPTTFNLNDVEDDNVPAWVKSLRETAKSM